MDEDPKRNALGYRTGYSTFVKLRVEFDFLPDWLASG